MSTSTSIPVPGTAPATEPPARRRRRLGLITSASLAAGAATGVALVFAPFVPADEAGAAGALLTGFAVGWALLAVLSGRFTDQPQRWAFVPAVVMAVAGLASVVLGSTGEQALTWIWPPTLLALSVWMLAQVRRRVRGAGAKALLYPVAVLLALASIGGAAETVLEAYDASRFPMAGQLVDVDGHRMHLSCIGTGSPTVVLEPGAGDMASTMARIAPVVAHDTRVCVYDRPGRGWSEPSDAPQDGARVASDLHALLRSAHVPGPYVLAGHSFGGLYVLAYAARYPSDVAGLVLVDSTAPVPSGAVAPAVRNDAVVRASALVSLLARVGLGRLYAQSSYGELPAEARDEVRASIARSATLRSTIDEYVQGNLSMQEAAQLRTLGDRPLFVLTAGSGSSDTWFAKQDDLARLSTNSAHRVVAGAVHESLVTDEAAASSTAAAIREVVASVRTGTPLAT